MTVFKSGDLVVLKSGGPVMTVDTVNTDILDDDKITGVLCAWFVGEKLERVRFDHRAIEPAHSQQRPGEKGEALSDATDDYTVALGEVVAAMNLPSAEDDRPVRAARKKPRSARAPLRDGPTTVVAGIDDATIPS
jgi:uncharacterized protein YodC (DUF2158 family)